MSRLAEFRKLEEQLAAQLAELEAMKKDGSLQKEMAFEEKLRALMAEYGVSLKGVISLLDPKAAGRVSSAAASTGQRKARDLKIYVHPDTQERIETKGGNHKILKAWKEQYGTDTVESWRAQ